MASTTTSLLALCIALLAAASPIAQAVDDKPLGDAAQLPVDGSDARRKLQQGGLVASIVCASSGWCDDGRGGRYYDEGRDEGRRRDYDRDRRDYDRDGDRDGRGYGNGGYGRKLKQGGVVANIICDATGGCDDGRGGRYYDENRDERRRNGGYNNGGYNNGYNNNGYNNNGYNNNGYGRKLKQGGIVANIICDTLGNCNDNGRRYYDGDRDDRRRGGYNNGGYNNGDRDRDGRGYGNNGYGNGGYGK